QFDPVVAFDGDLAIQILQIVYQVVGEAVVIVDHQYFSSHGSDRFRDFKGLVQGAQFVIGFLQFVRCLGGGHQPGPRLVVQLVVLAQKGADHNGVVEVALEVHEPNGAPVEAAAAL